ncbi:MAG: hypothetical protein ACI4AB_00660 [Acetatifactor sp.]
MNYKEFRERYRPILCERKMVDESTLDEECAELLEYRDIIQEMCGKYQVGDDQFNECRIAIQRAYEDDLEYGTDFASRLFWLTFLINPLAAISAYLGAEMLGGLDIYTAFKDAYYNMESCTLNYNHSSFVNHLLEAAAQDGYQMKDIPIANFLDIIRQHDKTLAARKKHSSTTERYWMNPNSVFKIYSACNNERKIEMVAWYADGYFRRLHKAGGMEYKDCISYVYLQRVLECVKQEGGLWKYAHGNEQAALRYAAFLELLKKNGKHMNLLRILNPVKNPYGAVQELYPKYRDSDMKYFGSLQEANALYLYTVWLTEKYGIPVDNFCFDESDYDARWAGAEQQKLLAEVEKQIHFC